VGVGFGVGNGVGAGVGTPGTPVKNTRIRTQSMIRRALSLSLASSSRAVMETA
jgi:hypothetical protein